MEPTENATVGRPRSVLANRIKDDTSRDLERGPIREESPRGPCISNRRNR